MDGDLVAMVPWGESYTIPGVLAGEYKLYGQSTGGSTCIFQDTVTVTVTGVQCQSTLTEVSRTNNSAGIWCPEGIQVEFAFNSNACYDSWSLMEGNTQLLGYGGSWSALKGQHIIATIPAPKVSTDTYTFLAFPNTDLDLTCGASHPVTNVPTNGCDGSLSSGLKHPLSAVGAEDAVYWFKLSTSSCSPGPWSVLLTNTITQAVFAGSASSLSDTITVVGLPPGTYAVQYEYVASYCQGTGGDITVPECVPTTFYEDTDGDGFGDPQESVVTCTPYPPSGYSSNDDDEDIDHPTYADNDGDGHGSGPPTPGGVTSNDDPDDSDGSTFPGAPEICDGADNDGDGYVDAQLPTGLAMWMPFTGNAMDIGPNTMGSAVVGAALVADRFGVANKAYRFNGTSDRIEVPAHTAIHSQNVTVSCWVKFNGTGTGPQYQTMVGKGLGGGDLDSYTPVFDQDNNMIGSFSCNGGACVSAFASNPLLSGWRHFAAVHDDTNNQLRIYLNGVLVGTTPTALSMAFDSNPLTIGCDRVNGGYGYFANADIDEVMVFGRALSSSEIMSVYHVTSSPAVETQPYVLDADGDAFYTGTAVNACTSPGAGYQAHTTQQTGDCDDSYAAINPLATEVCDGLDNNCDGLVDLTMTAGTKLYLPFTGNANDASINAHHGTMVDAILATGHTAAANTAYQFNGTNSRIEVLDHVDLRPASFTLSAWFYYTAVPGGIQCLVNKPLCGGWASSYGFWFSDGQFFTGWGNGPASMEYYGHAAPAAGQWHHVALTFDDPGNVARVYMDNVLLDSYPTAFTIFYDATPLVVGVDYEYCAVAFPFSGKVDEVLLLDRALSGVEVSTLFTNGPLEAITTPETCNGVDDDCDGLVDEGCYIYVNARAVLDGPYNTSTGLMNDALRSLGTFPLTDPYPGLGYTHVGSGNGGSVAPAVIAAGGNDAIVDWVVLELRNPAAVGTVVASRSALV